MNYTVQLSIDISRRREPFSTVCTTVYRATWLYLFPQSELYHVGVFTPELFDIRKTVKKIM